MKKLIINIVSDNINIKTQKVLDWKKKIESDFICDDIFSLTGSPFQAIVVTQTNASPREIVFKIGDAFGVTGKKTGKLYLELTEFNNDVKNFETLPFFEHELPLKNILAKKWFTDSGQKEVSITLYRDESKIKNQIDTTEPVFSKKQLLLLEVKLKSLFKISLISPFIHRLSNLSGLKIILKPLTNPDTKEIEKTVREIIDALDIQISDLNIRQSPVYCWKNSNEI